MGKGTRDSNRDSLIVGGKPSGRASEFAFPPKVSKAFETFKPDLTHAIGFHYQCNDEDFYVVTGGYDMVDHGPNKKAYKLDFYDNEPVSETNEYILPVYQAAFSKYQI